jgi:quinol monooxygenase YgiN
MASTHTATATVTKGLLVRLESKPGKEDEVERFLVEARPLVEQEPQTTAWFAVRFGRSEYGIFDVFADEPGREAHLRGAVAGGLAQRADELFAEAPRVERLDVLADKLPSRTPTAPEPFRASSRSTRFPCWAPFPTWTERRARGQDRSLRAKPPPPAGRGGPSADLDLVRRRRPRAGQPGHRKRPRRPRTCRLSQRPAARRGESTYPEPAGPRAHTREAATAAVGRLRQRRRTPASPDDASAQVAASATMLPSGSATKAICSPHGMAVGSRNTDACASRSLATVFSRSST